MVIKVIKQILVTVLFISLFSGVAYAIELDTTSKEIICINEWVETSTQDYYYCEEDNTYSFCSSLSFFKDRCNVAEVNSDSWIPSYDYNGSFWQLDDNKILMGINAVKRWDGIYIMEKDADFSNGNWTYKVTEYSDYYTVLKDSTIFKLPKKIGLEYDFDLYRISSKITIDSLPKMDSYLATYDKDNVYLNISTDTYEKNIGDFYWDDSFSIRDSGVMYLCESGTCYNYSYIDTEKGSFNSTEGQLRFYVDDDWFSTAVFPIYLYFNSFILNSTNGWNGTFTQTNLNENESVMLDFNESVLESFLGWWSFDEFNGTGAMVNLNTSNQNLIKIGSPIDAVGVRNRSNEFDGTETNYWNAPQDGTGIFNLPNDMALAFKFKPISREGRMVYSIGNNGSGNNGFRIDYIVDGTIRAVIFTSGVADTLLTPDNSIDDGDWHTIIMQRDGDSLEIYTDCDAGVSKTVTTDSLHNFGGVFSIGSFSQELNGSIDEVILFDRALNTTERNYICDNPYYPTGNFTTEIIDWGSINITDTISFNGTVPTDTFINIFHNFSSDNITWNIELIKKNASENTIYSVFNNTRYTSFIMEMNTSISATPTIDSIEIVSINPSVPTINLISPANNTFTVGTLTKIFTYEVIDQINVTQCSLITDESGTLEVVETDFFNDTSPINATSITVLFGAVESGTVEDLAFVDGNELILEEVTGSPGFDYYINYTDGFNMSADLDIRIFARYDPGNAPHVREFGLWNWTSSECDGNITIALSAVNVWHNFTISAPWTDYISGNNVSICITHPSSGNANHRVPMDYAQIFGETFAVNKTHTFNHTFSQAGIYEWLVNCTNEINVEASSETRILIIASDASDVTLLCLMNGFCEGWWIKDRFDEAELFRSNIIILGMFIIIFGGAWLASRNNEDEEKQTETTVTEES